MLVASQQIPGRLVEFKKKKLFCFKTTVLNFCLNEASAPLRVQFGSFLRLSYCIYHIFTYAHYCASVLEGLARTNRKMDFFVTFRRLRRKNVDSQLLVLYFLPNNNSKSHRIADLRLRQGNYPYRFSHLSLTNSWHYVNCTEAFATCLEIYPPSITIFVFISININYCYYQHQQTVICCLSYLSEAEVGLESFVSSVLRMCFVHLKQLNIHSI